MKQFLDETIFGSVAPRQPLMVMAAEKYYKYVYSRFGISHFYSFTAKSDVMDSAQVVPDGCVDIIFRCGEDYGVDCYGTRLLSHSLAVTPTIKVGSRVFGVRFFQGQAYLPGGFPEAELTEKHINMYDIMKDHDTLDQICKSTDFIEQIHIFLAAYLKDYHAVAEKSEKNRTADYMLRRMLESHGLVRQQDLSTETAYSVRHLNELFRKSYGASPKMYCRMIQYQYLINLLRTGQCLSDITFQAGFYDQAHFIHEFESFTNMPPSKYLQKLQDSGFDSRLVVVSK